MRRLQQFDTSSEDYGCWRTWRFDADEASTGTQEHLLTQMKRLQELAAHFDDVHSWRTWRVVDKSSRIEGEEDERGEVKAIYT